MLVDVKGLNVYQEDKLILQNVNMHVDVGEFVYLIGKVGSGKSSLLKTLYCELPVAEGEVSVVGYDLKKIKNSKIPMLRRKIGMVFQDFELMNDRSVYENLRFVLRATGWKDKQEIETRINEVLKSVGMLDKKMSMPAQLSGGERQSVSVARALLNNPPIIFADEPTGNLDPESADVIVNLLYKLCESGKSVLMVTHNHGFFRKYAGRIYTFGNQTVTEQGDNKIAIAIDDLDDMETPAVEAFEAEIESNVQTQFIASQSEEHQNAPSTDPSADAQGAAQDATQGTQGEEAQSECQEINSDNVQAQNFASQSENIK
ncbi:MAG: ATP-binding cassette domain-containing protein [Bacteroidales bacterium]|nr:ATP-binding cassette domain-containing protein [Bacteroidales bacterium]